MKSIKTNPNSAKGPDEGKIVLHIIDNTHCGKADDRNCKYGHPKMADVESGKNLFC